jgi:hypothetical protein
MPLPLPPNTTCEIYRTGHAPPAAPDVALRRCHLAADYERRMETGESETRTLRYTHVLLLDPGTDVRDGFSQFGQAGTEDSVYVPDRTGTRFRVVLVEPQDLGLPTFHARVYLDRYAPAWPTTNL